MAIPRVFISSTCYDLKYIRENIKYFVKTIGYEPILNEDGGVFYDPSMHTHDACLSEVPNCQLFVLIIGGRYGGQYIKSSDSITNEEYREAIKQHIPVFALVEQSVYAEHFVYTKNRDNKEIIYPSVDTTDIFDFIDEVRKCVINNAIIPFRDFSDIEDYLRKQWAGMMCSFLTAKNEDSRVADIVGQIKLVNEKIEFISTQTLKAVGSVDAKLTVEFYNLMLGNRAVEDMIIFRLKPEPVHILKYETFLDCVTMLGIKIDVLDESSNISISSDGRISQKRLKLDEESYNILREKMVKILSRANIEIRDFTTSQEYN